MSIPAPNTGKNSRSSSKASVNTVAADPNASPAPSLTAPAVSSPVAPVNINKAVFTSNEPSEVKGDLNLSQEFVDQFSYDTAGIMESITKILYEGSSILSQLNPKDFEMFGKMSSHEYRKIFFRITKDLSTEARIWILILFTAIKSKPRVMAAMGKFKDQGWYTPTREFIMQKMVQYTKELPADQSKFAAVHVPHIMPSFTAICWLKITIKEKRTVKNFLENLWACQMDIPNDLMERQKRWEIDFWDNRVVISRNVTRDNTPLEFHENFWATKAADKYPFYLPNGKSMEVRSESDLQMWIDSWSAYV